MDKGDPFVGRWIYRSFHNDPDKGVLKSTHGTKPSVETEERVEKVLSRH
jgi:hypothetical protein